MELPATRFGWERMFWLVFWRSESPIAIVDEERRFVEVNSATLAAWKRERDQVVGTPVTDFVPNEDRIEAARRWRAVLGTEDGEFHGSATAVRGDGSLLDFEFAARMVRMSGRRLAVYVMLSQSERLSGLEPAEDPKPSLTEREREIVTAIALGHETATIAEEFHISPETVRTHVRNAMSKLGTHTRAHLVARVLSEEKSAAPPQFRGVAEISPVCGIDTENSVVHDPAMAFGRVRARTRQMAQGPRQEGGLLDAVLDTFDLAVIACSPDGRLAYVNRRARELIGLTCPTGSAASTWIRECGLRTTEGLPLPLQGSALLRALGGQPGGGVDVIAAGDGGDALTADVHPMVDDEGAHVGTVMAFKAAERPKAEAAAQRLPSSIAAAVDADRLLLYAQPIVDMCSGDVVMEELLLRLRAPDGTISSPGKFLEAAEAEGSITELDTWVFGQAVRIAGAGRPVTVNVSARTVGTPSFLGDVEASLARERVDPSLITFEITETAVVSDIVQATRFASRLDEIGCPFALDDFGTGYAALTYLKHLPVRYLKIDIEFVRDLAENPGSRRVVNGVVALAASFNHQTIAEGVEDPHTYELLSGLGVDLAQGYGVGEPAPIRGVVL